MWGCLDVEGGQEQIAVGDLKVFLMAIFGIKGNKRLEILNSDNIPSAMHYGWINEKNLLCLSREDVLKISQKFQSLNFNRIHRTGKDKIRAANRSLSLTNRSAGGRNMTNTLRQPNPALDTSGMSDRKTLNVEKRSSRASNYSG